jgi:hypothetical protein
MGLQIRKRQKKNKFLMYVFETTNPTKVQNHTQKNKENKNGTLLHLTLLPL